MHEWERIIPARAGFTRSHFIAQVMMRDHPRSRGVYRVGRLSCGRNSGSSPLARGLRAGSGRLVTASRIIPARAGFTSCGRPGRAEPVDHPRSRGVYGFPDPLVTADAGSSPLARGLRVTTPDGRPIAGIIPARAGFTRHHARRAPHRRDHPRSRGVYGGSPPGGVPAEGSSPLARGLRLGSGSWSMVGGIIPARAGFTHLSGRTTLTTRDHPRSRGVYVPFLVGCYPVDGSSPLARGLRSSAASAPGGCRIIPARAGFTGCCLG